MQGLGIAVFPQRTEELLVVFSAIPLLPFKIRGALWEHRLTNPAMRQIAVQIGPCIQTLALCNQKGRQRQTSAKYVRAFDVLVPDS